MEFGIALFGFLAGLGVMFLGIGLGGYFANKR
jgi:hypothetical protein